MNFIKKKARQKLRAKTGINKESLEMSRQAENLVNDFILSMSREELNRYTKNYMENIIKECEKKIDIKITLILKFKMQDSTK